MLPQPAAASQYQIQNSKLQTTSSMATKTDEFETADDNDDENEFFDATDSGEGPYAYHMDLDNALEEAKLAIDYFFNNRFDEARELMRPYADSSMYHSMGHAVFQFLEAILTFEQQHIIKAGEELKKCLEVCQRQRKKNTISQSIGKTFKRANYSQLTDLESHAELCSAEALLLRAVLTFIEDETLSSLIRGSFKIRQCFNSYKECAQILHKRQWETESSRIHFESGVRMGTGTFNLMISLLPARVIKILEFIGFSGNKASGLADLHRGYELCGLRQVLCALTLLGYHLIVCYVLSHQGGDLNLCNEILEAQLKQYPKGVWFLFFKGRLDFMQGNLEQAQYWYKKSWKSQTVWPQFHHLSFWELLWVNCLRLDWREASLYATYLVEQSKWSRTIYSYQKAAVMLMIDGLTLTEQQTIEHLMRDAPKYKQRIAGKSLPMEKFICKKAARYFQQDKQLLLPAIELMYVWNAFKVMGKKYEIADGIYQLIERKMQQLQQKPPTDDPYAADNKALCLLLRGACYRQMKKTFLALQDLEACIALHPHIVEDNYLIAYAAVETGLLHADENRTELAIATLEDAKKRYTGYSLESRLHFRIHAALMELKEKQSPKK